MVKKYYLTSVGGMILASLMTLIFSATTIVLSIFYEQTGILSIIFSLFFVIFASFGTYLCFTNTIKLDFKEKRIVIKTLKKKVLNINEIDTIIVSTENSLNIKKYCNIIFNLKNNSVFKINGFLSIFKHRDVEKTQKLISNINMELKKHLD